MIRTSLLRRTWKGLLTAAALATGFTAGAQTVSSYGFSQTSGTYAPLSGATVIATASSADIQDDNNFSVTLPFSFTFNGTPYTSATVNTNGWMSFGTAGAGNNYAAIASTEASAGFIAAFNTDMDGRFRTVVTMTSGSPTITVNSASGIFVGETVSGTGIPAGTTVTAVSGNTVTLSASATSNNSTATRNFYSGVISTQILGTAPNRIFVVQWSGFSPYASNDNNYNFQIQLAEGGGIAANQTASIVYGSFTSASSGSVQVGLRGAANTDFNDRSSTTSWAATVAGTANTATVSYSSTMLPASGLTFVYTPPAPCTGTPAGGAAVSSTANACINTPFTLSTTGTTSGVSNLTYQWQSRLTSGGTFTAIAGATGATYTVASQTVATDYRLAVTCTSSGLTGFSTQVSVGQSTFTTCYCTPTGGNCTNEWVNGVTFNTLSNLNTGCTTGGYADYRSNTALTTTVVQGATYNITLDDHINATASQIGVWIDYDHSGTYDASEFTLVGTGPTTGFANISQTFTAAITIPATALTGVTGMRVFANNGTITAASGACSTGFFGEKEDYLITINAGTPCTGTPGVAVASSSTTNACPSTPFTLTATNLPNTLGITYQWQSSASSTGPFTAISGATTVPYTIANQTTATFYRLVITCANSSASSTSNVVSVGQNPFSSCYCTPAAGTSTSYYINNFSTTGATTNITNNGSGYSTNGYGNFTSQTLGTAQNATVNFSAAFTGGTFGFAIFIDYNHNGSFADAGETVYNTTSYTSSATGSFVVPAAALTGATRMRIVADFNNSNPSSEYCGPLAFGQGEFEDYTVTIAASTACAGTPAVAVASSSVANACYNASFTLNATNLPAAGTTGITYQWQSSPAGAGTFTAISGATTVPYTVTSQTAATDYRLIITCSNSTQSSTSNVVSVGQNANVTCYCIPPASTSSSYYIDNFATTGGSTNITNNASGYSTNGYGNFTSMTVTAQQTGVVNFSAAFAGGTFGFAIFIDLNHNGTFADAGEVVYNTTGYASSASGSFTVPAGALTGNTRLRIVADFNNTNPSSEYCGPLAFSQGEFEDYTINITPATPCSGTPAVAVASSSVAGLCSGSSLTLNATNLPASGTGGITYQWQSRPTSGGTFANITGATTVPYTVTGQTVSTDYRLVITCTNSTLSSTSNAVTVTMNNFYQCYCSTGLGGASGTASIDSVKILNTTLNNNTPGSATTLYTAYPQSGSTTATLCKTTTYTLHTAYGNGPAIASLWIDYDHSGTFDASEFTQITTSSSSVDVTFTVPASALSGLTGLRIRSRSAGNTNGATDACSNFGSGETEDYIITIGTNPVVNLGNDTTICPGSTITLNAGNAGSTYAFSNGATTQTTNITTAATYTVAVTNAGCTGRDTIVVAQGVNPVVNLGNDTAICPGATITLNAGNAGSSYLYNGGATTQTLAVTTGGTYSVRVTNATGCIGRDTIVVTQGVNPVVNLGNDTTVCPGATITLNAGNAGSTYLYNGGATTQTLAVTAGGTYSVRVTNASNCVGRDTVVITQGVTPVVNLGPDTLICSGTTLTLNAGNTGSTYLYNTGATTQTLAVTATGAYSVAVTNAGNCVGRDTILVGFVPSATVSTITPVVTSPSAAFTSDAQNATSYAWTFGDGGTDNTASPSHTYTANGTYTVQLIISNLCGADTATATVTITGLHVGSFSLSDAQLSLYPNPATNLVVLDNKSSVHMQSLMVLNSVGAQVIMKDHIDAKKETLDLSALPSGSYLIRIATDGGSITRRVQVLK